MDHKKTVKLSIDKYLSRQIRKSSQTKRHNQKPEKELEKAVLEYLRQQGWKVFVVESKAVYNVKAGSYISGQTVQGFSDLVGLTPTGLFVAIELKSKGRLSTLRETQHQFLTSVIENNGLALVVDSLDRLKNCLEDYRQASNKRKFLLDSLPTPPSLKRELDPLF